VIVSLSGSDCGGRLAPDTCPPGLVPTTAKGNCIEAPAGSPARHTEAEVCAKWKTGHVISTPDAFIPGNTTCDPGSIKSGAIADTVLRLNMFRWMVGLPDVKDDASKDIGAQSCAVIAAWNPQGEQAHHPQPSATCFNSLGAMAAGEGSIAWELSTTGAIDGYMEDFGRDNYNALGHRRAMLYPPLALVGVGYNEHLQNGVLAKAQCLDEVDASGMGPWLPWYAFPPPGYSPVSVTKWPWTFHLRPIPNDPRSHIRPGATVAVKNLSTQADAPITIVPLDDQCCADDAISFYPTGWTPKVGEAYRVIVNTMLMDPITYDVIPADCP